MIFDGTFVPDSDYRRALIADDDEFFRMALSAILTREFGFSEVMEADSFDGAVKMLKEADGVALALFDLSMPGIESAAALRTIRESSLVEKLGVVTASERRSDMLLALEAGAHGFVSKGQGVGHLRRALEQILDGIIYIPPFIADLESRSCEPPKEVHGAEPTEARLTPRQWQVLRMLVEGKSNKEIARALNLGPGTIKVHLTAIFRNLGVSNRARAAVAGERLLRSTPPRVEIEPCLALT